MTFTNTTDIKNSVDAINNDNIDATDRKYLADNLSEKDIKWLFHNEKENTETEIINILNTKENITTLKSIIDSITDIEDFTNEDLKIEIWWEDITINFDKEDFYDILILYWELTWEIDTTEQNFNYTEKAEEYFTTLKTNTQQQQSENIKQDTRTITEILNQDRTSELAKEFIEWWNEAEFNKIVDNFELLSTDNETNLASMISMYTNTNTKFSSLSIPWATLDYPNDTKIIATEDKLITFWDNEIEYKRRIEWLNELTKNEISNKMDYLVKKWLNYKSNETYYETLKNKMISFSNTSDYSLITKYVNLCKTNKKYLWTNTSWNTIINDLLKFINENKIDDKNLLSDLTKLKATLNNWWWDTLSIKNLWEFVRGRIMQIVTSLWLDDFMEQMWRWESMIDALFSKFELTNQQNIILENVIWIYDPSEEKQEIWDAKYNRTDLQNTRKSQFLNNRNLLDPNLVNMIAKENLSLEEDDKWKIKLNSNQKENILENIMSNWNFKKDLEKWMEELGSTFENTKVIWYITASIMNYKANGNYLSKVYERSPILWWNEKQNNNNWSQEDIEDEEIEEKATETLKEINNKTLDENNIEWEFNKIFIWEWDQEKVYNTMCENIENQKDMIAKNLIQNLTALYEDTNLKYNQTKIKKDLEEIKKLDTDSDWIIDNNDKISETNWVLTINWTNIDFNKYQETYSKTIKEINENMDNAKTEYTDNGRNFNKYKTTIKTEYDKIFKEDNYDFIVKNIDDYKNLFTSTKDWENYIKTYLSNFNENDNNIQLKTIYEEIVTNGRIIEESNITTSDDKIKITINTWWTNNLSFYLPKWLDTDYTETDLIIS